MRGPRSERLRLLHILDAADRILLEYDKVGGEKPDIEDIRYYGFLRLMEVIGEASYKLTREFRAAHPQVPWQRIIATRHIIVHEYDDVDEDRIWDVISNHLPVLRQQIQTIIDTLPA